MTLAMLLVLALQAPPAASDDLFKGVKMGDRVEITLKSEFMIRGKLVQPGIDEFGKPITKVDPKLDLATLPEVTLDISMEYPDMNGTMGFHRVQIAGVQKLRELTAEEAQAIEKERQRQLALSEKENAARRARSARDEQERQKEREDAEALIKKREAEKVGADLIDRAANLKKAAEVWNKFPPSAGWGPARMKEILEKSKLHMRPTAEEQEFMDNFEQWNSYDQHLKSEKEKKDDKALPSAPPAPSPSPAPETK